jgi:hypothetical protein
MLKKFTLYTSIFIALLLLPIVIGFFLPSTPRASTSLLFAQIDKDKLLTSSTSPRLILIGGSNLSFGIKSKIIKDSLNVNPINTGISASLGLIYMLKHTQPFVKQNDVVIVIPEYEQFYGELAYGKEELLRMLLDVKTDDFSDLNSTQLMNISAHIPAYSFSKFKWNEYINPELSAIYSKNSFNEFGDAVAHYKLPSIKIKAINTIKEEFNSDVINELKLFQNDVKAKGAKLYISFPGTQQATFNILKPYVNEVEKALRKEQFSILGKPEDYVFNDSLIFNSAYHLTEKGAEKRTIQIIKNLKE